MICFIYIYIYIIYIYIFIYLFIYVYCMSWFSISTRIQKRRQISYDLTTSASLEEAHEGERWREHHSKVITCNYCNSQVRKLEAMIERSARLEPFSWFAFSAGRAALLCVEHFALLKTDAHLKNSWSICASWSWHLITQQYPAHLGVCRNANPANSLAAELRISECISWG